MIVVSAQLTDWGEKSAQQAIELTEYFLGQFAVDPARVYAAGYSAGGETMSRAVSMRPDLYAAYLHGASQWDGDYAPIAENGVVGVSGHFSAAGFVLHSFFRCLCLLMMALKIKYSRSVKRTVYNKQRPPV